ncbi:MAG TPA: iron chelate uptake ABC transporter family permease subunit, partial [Dietzia timorensis]
MTTQTKQSNETYVGAPAGGEPGFSRALRRAAARHAVFLAVSVALLAGIVAASLFSGSGEVAAGSAWQVLWSPDDSAASIIVHDLRVPRTVLGLVVGMALGVAGALIQAVTRNPLADPGILGVNAGASFAVTLGIAFLGVEAVSSYVWLAMAGAAIASIMVFGIAAGGGKGATPLRLTLVGMAFGSVLLGANRAIGLLDSSIYEQVRFWEAGSVADRPPE